MSRWRWAYYYYSLWNTHIHTTLYEIINKDSYSTLHNKLYGKKIQKRTRTCLCISESCHCPPKTKNKNKHPIQHCKSPIHQYKIQIIEGEYWLCSPQASVTWAAVTSLKPGQSLFPRTDCHGADGAGEDKPANEPCPMELVSLFFSASAHDLQIQAGPPAVRLWLLHPKGLEPLGWKSFDQLHWLHVSWCWGSHLQPPFLGSPHLWVSWRRKWQPTPGSLPGKSPGHRSLVGCSPWGLRVRHDWATNTPPPTMITAHSSVWCCSNWDLSRG